MKKINLIFFVLIVAFLTFYLPYHFGIFKVILIFSLVSMFFFLYLMLSIFFYSLKELPKARNYKNLLYSFIFFIGMFVFILIFMYTIDVFLEKNLINFPDIFIYLITRWPSFLKIVPFLSLMLVFYGSIITRNREIKKDPIFILNKENIFKKEDLDNILNKKSEFKVKNISNTEILLKKLSIQISYKRSKYEILFYPFTRKKIINKLKNTNFYENLNINKNRFDIFIPPDKEFLLEIDLEINKILNFINQKYNHRELYKYFDLDILLEYSFNDSEKELDDVTLSYRDLTIKKFIK